MGEMTKAQREMLEGLAGGDSICRMGGVRSNAFWWRSMKTARIDTLDALFKRGLIWDFERDWRSAKFTITEAGRAALSREGKS